MLWTNDNSAGDPEPVDSVSLTVTKGLYSVLLGQPPMTKAIPVSVWGNADVRLRVWFNDGVNGFQLLAPDQRIAPNGYLSTGSVSSTAIASDAVTSAKIATGAVTNSELAAGAVQAANIAAGAVGSAQIGASSITAANLATGAVQTANIAAGAVTKAKLNLEPAGGPPTESPDGGPGLSLVLYPGSNTLGNLYPPHGFGIQGNTLYSVVPSGNRFVWYGGTVEIMRLTGTGNLGIGTVNPLTLLDLGAANGTLAGIRLGGISATASRFIGISTGNTITPDSGFSGMEFGGPAGGSEGFLAFHTHDVGVASGERMRIDKSGNVGIGLANPGAKLEVSNGTTSLQIRPGELNGVASAGAVTLEIPGAQTLGIWDSLSVNNNLTVVGNSNLVGYAAIGAGTLVSATALGVKKTASGHTCAQFLNEALTTVASIGTSNGYALYVNTDTGYAQRQDSSAFWSVSSDRRLKTGIVPLTGALGLVGRLNPVRYHYTEEYRAQMGGQADIERYGVIAQEYQEMFPQFVTSGKDGFLSVQSDPIIFITAAAVKELSARHDDAIAVKDAEIAALRKQLTDNDTRDKAIEARLAALERGAASEPLEKVSLKK